MSAFDQGLAGTQRAVVRVDAYHNGREPDGFPDEVVEVELFFEADGTQVTDPERMAAIKAAQEKQQDAIEQE